MSKYFVLIVIIHIILLLWKTEQFISPLSVKEERIVKIKIRKNVKKRKRAGLLGNLKTSDLISFSSLTKDEIEKHKWNKEGDYHKDQILLEQIDYLLQYEWPFVDLMIDGTINCVVFINEFKIDLGKTKCKGNRYLIVHLLEKIQESSRLLKIKKKMMKVISQFELTTNLDRNNSANMLNETYFFKRMSYGEKSKRDKIIGTSYRVLNNITNWFSLLEYLPKSDLEKRKIKNEIKRIESSPFY